MKQFLALAVGVLTAATLAGAALAGNDGKVTLGPSGYEAHGKSTLVIAGTANVVLAPDDRVVLCRAKKSGFEQSARPADHVSEGKSAEGDIVPPFVVVSKKGEQDASLAAGKNWSAANAAAYANACTAPASSLPADVCPNIEGLQTSVPAGLTAIGGRCVAASTAATPGQTVIVEKVVVEKVVVTIKMTPAAKGATKAKMAKKAVKAKKPKAAKKAKKAHKVKKAHKQAKHAKVTRGREAFDSGAVPHRRK